MMLRTAIFALFFLSGMAGIIYQVVWTKLLTLTFGVTVLAVSTVLTCFFGGLALGSFLGGRWVDKHPDGFKWYGAAEALIGLYAMAFLPLLGVNNSIYAHMARAAGFGLFGLTLLKFILSAILHTPAEGDSAARVKRPAHRPDRQDEPPLQTEAEDILVRSSSVKASSASSLRSLTTGLFRIQLNHEHWKNGFTVPGQGGDWTCS